MFQGVDPIFTDPYMKFHNIALSIRNERNQAFAEHGIIPFTEEGIVMPVFHRSRHADMSLQLDVQPVLFDANRCPS